MRPASAPPLSQSPSRAVLPPFPARAAVLAAVLAALGAPALAQTNPNAGSILREVQPTLPPAPPPAAPGVNIERASPGSLPASAPFLVKSLRITGNTRIATPTLHALVADAEGKSLTLQQLGEAVARITAHYQAAGYPLARAIIPAQTIQDGVVDIQVIEARYGGIKLDNRSRVRDSLLQATLGPLQSGAVIEQGPMDRSLLLLSDIPGAQVGATLRPGSEVGTADLLVNAAPTPFLTGNVVLDGYGNRFTGRERLGGTLNVVNPLHHGDILSASVLTSLADSGRGLNYARLSYETLLNGYGTRLGGAYSLLRYRLGDSLDAIQAHGTAEVAGLWVRHPLLRGADLNLNGQLQFDHTKLRDHVDLIGLKTDRHLDTWTASLSGDWRDSLFSGGINTWNLRYTGGRVGFDDPAAQLADAATARTQGNYSKWNLNAARLQRIGPRDALYLVFAGQWANDNLDSSQKMSAGGPYTVRAYDTGAISGDSGVLGTAEWRHELGTWLGRWQAVAFADSAHVVINRRTWAAGVNSATLSGLGLGLNWSGPNQWAARLYVATPVGSTPALVPNTARARGWVEISKAF